MVKTDLVLCAITNKKAQVIDEDVLWRDLEDYSIIPIYKYRVIPLIDHPHSDKENGQNEIHYHVDSRYNGYQPQLDLDIQISSSEEIRVIKGKYKLERLPLMRHFNEYRYTTSVKLIKNSKLKHKCIHKGKCPHRGFDLSNIEAVDGVITCPLHSLKFNAETKKLIDEL